MAQDEEWLEKRKCWNATIFFFNSFCFGYRSLFGCEVQNHSGCIKCSCVPTTGCSRVQKGGGWLETMGVTIDPPENDIFLCFFFFLFRPPQQNLIIIIQNRWNFSVRTYCCIVNLAVDSWPRQTTKEMFQSAVFFVCFCCPYEVGTGCFNINIALVFFRDVEPITAANCQELSQQLLSFT